MGFYSSKVSIRKSDQAFSKFIRARDGECVFNARCQRRPKGAWEIGELQCCHFHSRRKESVRFDPENCDSGCPACHQFIDHTAEGIKWYREFKLNQLGQKRYDLLELRANTIKKRDDVMDDLYVKALQKQLIGGTPLSEGLEGRFQVTGTRKNRTARGRGVQF